MKSGRVTMVHLVQNLICPTFPLQLTCAANMDMDGEVMAAKGGPPPPYQSLPKKAQKYPRVFSTQLFFKDFRHRILDKAMWLSLQSDNCLGKGCTPIGCHMGPLINPPKGLKWAHQMDPLLEGQGPLWGSLPSSRKAAFLRYLPINPLKAAGAWFGESNWG